MSIQAKVALKDYIQLLLTYSQDKVTLKTKITNTVKNHMDMYMYIYILEKRGRCRPPLIKANGETCS